MANSYYTPTIEEFHVGFEYESEEMAPCGSGTHFVKDTIEKPDDIKNAFDFDDYCHTELRVKLLDREDIESLGWKYSNVKSEYFSKNGFDLVLHKDNFLTIYEDKGADEFSFRGTIKNKSELKKLMQQLSIADEL